MDPSIRRIDPPIDEKPLDLPTISGELRTAASYLRIACPKQVGVTKKIDEMAEALDSLSDDL